MHSIDRIGPILGIAAFLGLAIMAFLVFVQAREVRRLRNWAGQAPERASDADAATKAAAEAAGELITEDRPSPARQGSRRIGDFFGPKWEELDRRSPFDPRIVVGVIAAVAVAAGALTGGFGLFGSDAGGGAAAPKQAAKHGGSDRIKVAILNGTQQAGVIGVPGLADKVSNRAVDKQEFDVVETDDAPSGIGVTVVYYAPGADADAKALAKAVMPKLGDTAVGVMPKDVAKMVKGARVALVIGADDAGF